MMADPRPPYDYNPYAYQQQLSSSSSRQPVQFQHHPYSDPYSYNPPDQADYEEDQVQELPKQSKQRIPSFPLLHSRFGRDSTATATASQYSRRSKDANSYLNLNDAGGLQRQSYDSRSDYQDQDENYPYYDDESMYSDMTERGPERHEPALRDSWQSSQTGARHLSSRDGFKVPLENMPNAPTVVVSSWNENESTSPPRLSTVAGKAPLVKPASVNYNFSRPVRPSVYEPDDLSMEEHKKMVLNRVASRQGPSPIPSSRGRTPSPSKSRSLPPQDPQRLSPSSPTFDNGNTSSGNSSPLGPPSPSFVQASSTPSSAMSSPTGQQSVLSRTVTLSRKPPSLRASSPVSLYSRYSYYELGTPSPTDSGGFPDSSSSNNTKGIHLTNGIKQPPQRTTSRSATPVGPNFPQNYYDNSPDMSRLNISNNSPTFNGGDEDEAQHYLQLGIKHHEANDLRQSASYFEKSATVNGGCGVGMLMWGLTLRHGWGCEKNEKKGFNWLRKAAESAVEDLESARKSSEEHGKDGKAKPSNGFGVGEKVQSDLILAIYEVGQSFFHGWGVKQDQKMGVSYYRVAARLGDADAQNDLGFCLANGKGCKKDRKEAAKWYRAAVAQGQSDVGLAWIYKEKFQE